MGKHRDSRVSINDVSQLGGGPGRGLTLVIKVLAKQAFLHGGGGPGGVVKGIKSFEAVLKLPIADLLMKRQFVLFLDAK